MENGAIAPKEQMLHFQEYFQIHNISKVSKGVIMESRFIQASLCKIQGLFKDF